MNITVGKVDKVDGVFGLILLLLSVIYQPHEAAGELLTRSFRIAPSEVASLRVNRGSDRKLRKRQNSISKQM